ncbi:hypothetical protein BH20ACT24_BH20ACT24_06420 [soil metagenome]
MTNRGHEGPEAARETSPASISVQRRIEWSDTDASTNYHNTAAFRLFEGAETLMLARLGILGEVYGRLPRVRLEADFLAGLSFHDIVRVAVEVREVGRTSVAYDFTIRREDRLCVRGRAVAVYVDRQGRPFPWSEEHRLLLLSAGPQPGEGLAEEPAGSAQSS